MAGKKKYKILTPFRLTERERAHLGKRDPSGEFDMTAGLREMIKKDAVRLRAEDKALLKGKTLEEAKKPLKAANIEDIL